MLHESKLLSGAVDSSIKGTVQTSKRERSQLTGQDSVRIEISTIIAKDLHGMESQSQVGEHMSLKDVMKLPITYWLLIGIATLAEGLFIPFLDNGNKYYTTVFNGINEPEEAGIYLVMPYLVSALLVPVIGYASEKVKKRSYLIVASCFTFLLTYGLMLYLETSVEMRSSEWLRWLPVILLGLSIAMFCTIIMPTVPMIVDPKLLGTAFGIMEVFQNLAMGVFPIVIGAMREHFDNELEGFHVETQFLFIISCLCLGISFFLKTADSVSGGKIDVKDFRRKYVRSVMKEDPDSHDD